jgi:hypothetical protein
MATLCLPQTAPTRLGSLDPFCCQGFANQWSIMVWNDTAVNHRPREISEESAGFDQRQHRGVAMLMQNAARAALLLPLVLLGCSAIVLPREDAPVSGPDPSSYTKIAKRLEHSLKDSDKYDSFEISEFRWVHSIEGWTWLTCVRFRDRGHLRTYAVFIREQIVNSRFAVETDGCGTQNYTPFTQMPNAARPVNAGELEPLY